MMATPVKEFKRSIMKCKTLNTIHNAWKVAKYGAFSGLYFPAYSPNTIKDGPEKTPYLDTFHAVLSIQTFNVFTTLHSEVSGKSLKDARILTKQLHETIVSWFLRKRSNIKIKVLEDPTET